VARQASVFGRLGKGNKTSVLADAANLVNVPENRVPLEERFIYKYLREREVTKKEEKDFDDDFGSVASDEFEQLLDRYENDFKDDVDLAEEFKKNKRKLQKELMNDEDDESVGDDDEFDGFGDEDDDVNFDDDEDYKEAFKGIGEDLDDALDEMEDIPSKHIRRGRSKDVSSLFASADKFAELLERNEIEDDDGDVASSDDEDGGRKQRVTTKRPRGSDSESEMGDWEGGADVDEKANKQQKFRKKSFGKRKPGFGNQRNQGKNFSRKKFKTK
jgi:hypothetical protein